LDSGSNIVQSPLPSLRSSEASARQSLLKFREGEYNMYYVYNLKCKDGFYTGCTNDISDRLKRHNSGEVDATANRLPVSINFYFAVEDKYRAYELEKYFKSGSGRAFINKHLG
jgi:putative endonuclease